MRYFIGIVCAIISQASVGQEYQPNAIPTPPIRAVATPLPTTWGSPSIQNGSYTFAQPWQPYGASDIKLIDYLSSDYMRKQVDFSDEQNENFVKMQNEYRKELQSITKNYPELYKKDLPKDDRKVLIKKLQEEQTKLRKKFSDEAEEILVPHQMTMIKSMRFKQSVQLLGLPQTITRDPFQDDFDTTDKQKKELLEIQTESQKAIQQKVLEMQNEMAKMRADAKKKMLKVLNSKQKKLLEELEGEGNEKGNNGFAPAIPQPFPSR